MRRFGIFLLVVLCSGCATSPKGGIYTRPADQDPEMATILFYRPATFSLSARDVNIFIDGKPVKVLSNGSYAVSDLPAGTYKLGAKIKPYGLGGEVGVAKEYFEFEYAFEKGSSYYVGWFSALNSFVDKPKEYFIVSSKINPDEPYFEGALLDLNAEFGVVKKDLAIPELEKCRISLGTVDPEKI